MRSPVGVAGAGGVQRADAPHVVDVDAGGVGLSAIWAPAGGRVAPRCTVLAVHGRGMRAAYWNSFLDLATAQGHAVLAVDRPGYGASAQAFPEGLPLAEQAEVVHAVVKEHARTHDIGAGVFLLGHSDGGKAALHAAAGDRGDVPLLGLDTSGTGYRYDPGALHFPSTLGSGASRLNWGPLQLYPPGTFRASRALLCETPVRESGETVWWPVQYEELAPRVRLPVRFTFAEHEAWWCRDEKTLGTMASLLSAAPSVTVEHLRAAGHNVSLGRTAAVYHLRVLAFVEECLASAAGVAPGY
ncbi:alpha/beta hydrolase [Streptomyces sp. NPDC058877]|uniref:alpha/beta hydrolase n=1 Tax=Streptomyces sp. NPDC058877 TaxID=3346665 RepID=UPI0036D074A0